MKKEQELSARADALTGRHRAAGGAQRRRNAALEQVQEQGNRVGKVDIKVSVYIEQFPSSRIGNFICTTGQSPIAKKEQDPEQADGVGEIKHPVFIGIARESQIIRIDVFDRPRGSMKNGAGNPGPVSYTHLTLPTICSV